MARYPALVKYTPDGCAAIAKEGFASRKAALAKAMEAQGGRLEEYWAVDSFEWNAAFLLDTADDQTVADRVATFVVSYGLGYIENTLFLALAQVEDADSAMEGFIAPRVPGS